MRRVASYSHKGGLDYIERAFPQELKEVYDVIDSVDASQVVTKASKEKTMPGQLLYNPIALNGLFKSQFAKSSWNKERIRVETTVTLVDRSVLRHKGFREMDFVKRKLGVEVQFGKYAFMVYNVAAKMTIFHKQGKIDAGIEIVPMKSMADNMSTGVSYFEQFKTDLEMRGEADIDIPVLIMGIAP